MPVESCETPEETAALAAQAIALIDATLSRLTAEERTAFWASVRKCYNTPYNDPKPRALPRGASAETRSDADAVRGERAQPEMSQPGPAQVQMAMAAIPVSAPFVEAHIA